MTAYKVFEKGAFHDHQESINHQGTLDGEELAVMTLPRGLYDGSLYRNGIKYKQVPLFNIQT